MRGAISDGRPYRVKVDRWTEARFSTYRGYAWVNAASTGRLELLFEDVLDGDRILKRQAHAVVGEVMEMPSYLYDVVPPP